MASINISEEDFMVVASAAMGARDDGDIEQARKLDKIARKINAALTAAGPYAKVSRMMGGNQKPVRWQDMPSTLDPPDGKNPS
jgi:hypothetical protein